METTYRKDGLAGVSLRHLEVFSAVVRERSYTNAAVDLQMGRTNVKRVCDDFARIVGRSLLAENESREVVPTPFGQGVIARLGRLSMSLRKMEEGVKNLHRAGRALRFGADGGFFRGGLFTNYLGGLELSEKFRPSFLRVEARSAVKSLLSAECDVYFGIGLAETERLDRLDLGELGWNVSRIGGGDAPSGPAELGVEKWYIVRAGDANVSAELLEKFRARGAQGGEVIEGAAVVQVAAGGVVFAADAIKPLDEKDVARWPRYHFAALMRRHHPYADLRDILCMGGRKGLHGC